MLCSLCFGLFYVMLVLYLYNDMRFLLFRKACTCIFPVIKVINNIVKEIVRYIAHVTFVVNIQE